MFLKRIEMQGFKSFADRTVINFDSDIIGIVGPNGCGKSNISDAIRWVLGEQSAKSLRGSTMSDVIFAGTDSRKQTNFVEVVLVFDNSNHYLNSEFEEIEVCRRLHRISGESEYLINRNECRRSDIIDLILDSGLGKDSLSIISQGNVSKFAEDKPTDRRGIFEEAAGVAKYKKRKVESTSKLERTQSNLDRVKDIVDELEKQVIPLQRQAKKAELYLEKKAELEKIEVAVLVNDIQQFQDKISVLDKTLFDNEALVVTHNAQLTNYDLNQKELAQEANTLDKEIDVLQKKYEKITVEIQNLEIQKVQIDENRKYQLENANRETKLRQLQQLLNEAKLEYDDRKNRYNELIAKNELTVNENSDLTNIYTDLKQKGDNLTNTISSLQRRLDILQSKIDAPYQHQLGVQAIIKAKESLPGVIDVVASVITPEEGYETAISTALANALYNIITEDEKSARYAIDFLKRNHSGRATFLPISIIKPRYLSSEAEVVAQGVKGYLGVANDLLTCDSKYYDIIDNLLGTTIIMDNLENANNLANLLRHKYKLVTLDGDVVNIGGSMTGGKQNDNYSPLGLKKEYEEVKNSLNAKNNELTEINEQVRDAFRKLQNSNDELLQNRLQLANIEPILEVKKAKYDQAKVDYEALHPQENEQIDFSDELVTNLNHCYQEKDDIVAQIRLKRERRSKCNEQKNRYDNQIREIRREISQLQALVSNSQIEKTRYETRVEEALLRLNRDYNMTLDFASRQEFAESGEASKQRVEQLRKEIQALGNINMEAPEEYASVNARYEELNKQFLELTSSKEKILSAIKEMDEVMEKQFYETFVKINQELQGVFTVLFGGGKAKLFLEDPNDILNSGIDIDVQPPGKNIQNIRLFSGGEKTLIAICVLFSIIKARPIPLCIFDEVEAALDQGNVERFAKYLHEFKADTQFIVVTHRPGTMEQCDTLYGVTMPKQGVSQLLQVRLKEAIEFSGENQEVVE